MGEQSKSRRAIATSLFLCPLCLLITGCEALLYPVTIIACGLRPDLDLHPETLPIGTVGVEYSVRIDVEDNKSEVGGVSIKDGSLPPGLSLRFERRLGYATIEGNPREPGRYDFDLDAYGLGTFCAGQRGSRKYAIRVEDAAEKQEP